jgi:replicative DNA helicase
MNSLATFRPTSSLGPVPAATGSSPEYRQQPHNIEAEQALLGALLVNNKALERVAEFLRAEHFFDAVHNKIFSTIVTLVERGQMANPVTLKPYFETDAALQQAWGGVGYLAQLAASVITVVNAEDYGRTLHDLYLRRQLIDIGESTVISAYQPSAESSAMDQIEGAEARLFDLASTGDVRGGFLPLERSLTEALRTAESAFKRDTHITGVTTGLRDLDRKLGGLQKSDLVILAARPAMGKSSLAANIAFAAAKACLRTQGREGAGAAFFSLEMSAEQLANRILSDACSIPSDKIRRGEIKQDDFQRIYDAAQTIYNIPLYIDDTPGLSIAGLRTRVRRLIRQHPHVGLIVIDYLQLLRGNSSRGQDNRVQEISEITRGLKIIAKELQVPVLALSQLSRAVETREDKRPQLADLRESGTIEQDADVVMFIYRQEYYLSREEPVKKADEADDKFLQRCQRWQENMEKVHNMAEVIIAKQRHGAVGTVELYFDGMFTRFADMDKDHSG